METDSGRLGVGIFRRRLGRILCTQFFRSVSACFGKRCRSFRFGDRWMDQRTMRLLNTLGVRFDLTSNQDRAAFRYCRYGRAFSATDPIIRTSRANRTSFVRRLSRARTLATKMRLTEIPISTAADKNSDTGTLYLANEGVSLRPHRPAARRRKDPAHRVSGPNRHRDPAERTAKPGNNPGTPFANPQRDRLRLQRRPGCEAPRPRRPCGNGPGTALPSLGNEGWRERRDSNPRPPA